MTVCVVAPMIAATTTHPPADGQSLAIVPFGVLIAVLGAISMWRHGVGRLVFGALVLAAALQAAVALPR